MKTFVRAVVEFAKGFFRFAAILTVIVVAYAFIVYWQNHRPGADVTLTTVTADTTFDIGRTDRKSDLGGQLFIKAVGEVDNSTAEIIVSSPEYPSFTFPESLDAGRHYHLPMGNVEKVWGGDYYESKARITYRHHGVKRGNLTIEAVFSYPPDECGFNWVNGDWCKVK